jgi:nucleoid DNA-binding protein
MAGNKTAAKSRSKSETYMHIAEHTGLSRKQVASVFDSLADLVRNEMGKKGPGVFTLPGLLKIKRVSKPATKTRTIPNPFKPGEMMTVKGKPARSVVKALALKNLKEMVK